MGQAQSRRVSTSSTSSQTPLNPTLTAEKVQETFYSDANPHFTSVPDNNVSLPAPPSRTYRISELIDPYELLGLTSDDIVQSPPPTNPSTSGPLNVNKRLPVLVESPSGRTIGPQEFLAHPDRPLAIRERQEMIKQAMENASRNGSVGSRADSSRKGSAASSGRGRPAAGSRNGSESGSVGHHRNGSQASTRTYLTFEQAKIEEGRVAYQEKEEKRAKRGGRGWGCLTGCFGGKG